jgi:hypothetical protein
VGQAIAFRGLSCLAEPQAIDRVEKAWPVGGVERAFSPQRRLEAGVAGPRPAPREPGLSQFFMEFRAPQAHCNRRQKPIVCPTLDAGLSEQYWD